LTWQYNMSLRTLAKSLPTQNISVINHQHICFKDKYVIGKSMHYYDW
jgi:hypothetical protein